MPSAALSLTLSAMIGAGLVAVAVAVCLLIRVSARRREGDVLGGSWVAALTESEERFRTAFDETSIGMAILAADGDILRINAAFEQRILGYEAEELVGRPIVDLTHPGDRAADEVAVIEQVAGARRTFEAERRYRHRNGSWVWCLLTLSAVHVDGEVRQFVVQAQDVTQRRVIEEFLRESEGRYRSLVEHLPLITYRERLDEHSSTLFISPQIVDLLGVSLQEWIDDPTTFARTIHPEDRARVMSEVGVANAQRIDLACEFRVVTADGAVATLHKQGVIVFNDEGRPLYRQGYLLDVTERRSLETQLRLSQKLESVGQMAAGIAHEINTPIQFVGDSVAFVRTVTEDLLTLQEATRQAVDAVGGSAGSALRQRLDEAEEQADLDYIRERLPGAFARTADGIARVAAIVRAMKTFARPSTGVHAAVDLNDAVRTTLVVSTAEYRYVADVELDLDDALPMVPGDAGELNQVILNLVVNAAHAIQDADGGEGLGRITIATAVRDGAVELTVTDTGGGIPDAARARIFDPFFTTKEVGRGTGQGLAISRTIVVTNHGGELALRRSSAAGTTIAVRLPIVKVADTDLRAA